MKCPKCGFVQEERADCKKCGVVFAKFYVLHAQEPAAPPEPQEPLPTPNGLSEEHHPPEAPTLIEVQQNLRAFQQRFNELEFERAERRRIHGEIRALDLRLQDSLGRITARQEDVEQHISKLDDLPPTPTLHDFSELRMEVRAIDVGSVHKRIEHVESRLQSCTQELAAKADARLHELLAKLEGRLIEVEDRTAALAETQSATPENGAETQMDAALRGLEELKVALQNVTIRYTEIGELKKNHLVLRNMLEALQQATESLKKESGNGSRGKVIELENEVSALKAEVRKAYQRMELLEAQVPRANQPVEAAALKEVLRLREEVAASDRLRIKERQQIQAELKALQSKVSESLETLLSLPEKLELCSAQIRSLDQQYQPLTKTLERISGAANGTPQKIVDLNRDVAVLREELRQSHLQMQALQERLDSLPHSPPGANLQPRDEMGAIRESLDEIRRFMAVLTRKLSN